MKKVYMAFGGLIAFVIIWQGLNFALANLIVDQDFRVFISGMLAGMTMFAIGIMPDL